MCRIVVHFLKYDIKVDHLVAIGNRYGNESFHKKSGRKSMWCPSNHYTTTLCLLYGLADPLPGDWFHLLSIFKTGSLVEEWRIHLYDSRLLGPQFLVSPLWQLLWSHECFCDTSLHHNPLYSDYVYDVEGKGFYVVFYDSFDCMAILRYTSDLSNDTKKRGCQDTWNFVKNKKKR